MSVSNGGSRWLEVAVLGAIVVVSAAINGYVVKQALASEYAAIAALLGQPPKQFYDWSGGSGDSPIKVRGGAMMLLTKTWIVNQSNPVPSVGPYCTSIAYSTVVRTGFDKDTQDSQVLQLGDSNPWTITLYHSQADGTPDTTHGVVMRKVPRCVGDTLNLGIPVTISPLGSGDMFYPIPPVSSGSSAEQLLNGLHFRRYSNSSCGTSGDKDLCERVAGIHIQSDKINQTLNCSELDCTIDVGDKPTP